MAQPRLILASQSPRRRSLLEEAGYVFTVEPSDIDEESIAAVLPADLADKIAAAKVLSVAQRHPDAVVLAADTVVAFGDLCLGKPRDAAHARQMLTFLAGTTHIVITSVAVHHRAADFVQHKRMMSAVNMRHLSQRQIDDYIATGDWQGKAGGYGIQDKDSFVARKSGSFSNIVGLPMSLARAMLTAAGVNPQK
ncbi:MAG: septum formation protein Maf [Phycisphaerales bacterium]|nr:septum formation protein Maf [Phycisphaerales bacterium]